MRMVWLCASAMPVVRAKTAVVRISFFIVSLLGWIASRRR